MADTMKRFYDDLSGDLERAIGLRDGDILDSVIERMHREYERQDIQVQMRFINLVLRVYTYVDDQKNQPRLTSGSRTKIEKMYEQLIAVPHHS